MYRSRRPAPAPKKLYFIAAALADPRRVTLLDEPGVHLSPTGQRRLLTALRNNMSGSAAQVVVVTHNPVLVPAQSTADLQPVVHLANDEGHLDSVRLSDQQAEDLTHILTPQRADEFRAVLFAEGVVLVEGDHDQALIEIWAEKLGQTDASLSPEANNIVIHPTRGDTNFPPVRKLANVFDLRCAVITDGPAFKADGKLARAYRDMGLTQPTGATFDEVRDA